MFFRFDEHTSVLGELLYMWRRAKHVYHGSYHGRNPSCTNTCRPSRPIVCHVPAHFLVLGFRPYKACLKALGHSSPSPKLAPQILHPSPAKPPYRARRLREASQLSDLDGPFFVEFGAPRLLQALWSPCFFFGYK